MVAKEVKSSHEFDLFFCGLFLEFNFEESLWEMFVPKLLESFFWNEFAVLDSSCGTVDWCVSLFLNFLINFSNFPVESFRVEVWVIVDNEISKVLRDDFLFLLLVGVELKGTVENSSIIESGNEDATGFFFVSFHCYGCTASHLFKVLIGHLMIFIVLIVWI